MLDYIISTLRAIFNNERIRKEPPEEKVEEKKPKKEAKGLNAKKKRNKERKARKQGNMN